MSAPQSHKGIILVADDNEANRELLSALLSAEGYQVVCAADGRQALARVNSDSIDQPGPEYRGEGPLYRGPLRPPFEIFRRARGQARVAPGPARRSPPRRSRARYR